LVARSKCLGSHKTIFASGSVALAECCKANKFSKISTNDADVVDNKDKMVSVEVVVAVQLVVELTLIFIPEEAQAEKKQLLSIHLTPTTMTHDVLQATPPQPIKIPTREVSVASPQPKMTIHTIFGFTRHWETQQPPSKPLTPTYKDHAIPQSAISKLIVVLKSFRVGASEISKSFLHVGAFNLIVRNSEISLNFCKDCRIICEGEWEMKVDGEVKVDDNKLTESDEHLIDRVLTKDRPSIIKPHVKQRLPVDERPSINRRLRVNNDQVLVNERSSFKITSVIKKPPVDERPRVRQRPRVASKMNRPNCTQIVQYCGLHQFVEGVALCDFGGILPLSWSKQHFGMNYTRRSLQPLWSGLVGQQAVDACEV
jgi:hypothetical protein